MSRRHGASAAVLAVGLGFLIAAQSRANGELAHHVGSGLFPAWLTMTVGTALLVVIVLVHRTSRRGLVTVVGQARTGALPWWLFTGGVFGSVFLTTQSVTVPLVGVAVFTVGIVAGQTSGSLLVDRFGLTGTGRRAITGNRIAAALLAIAAVGVAVSPRLHLQAGVALIALLPIVAGFFFAPQQAFNGRVGRAAGSPFVGALGNFVGGAVLMGLILGVALAAGLQLQDPWGAPWWAYTGSVLGLLAIAGAAWIVPILGVLLYSLLSLFGQLAGAFLLDVVAPTPGTDLGWQMATGLAMTALAVLVAAAPRRSQLLP